ncbi:Carbon storage regulator-related protein [Pseudomonas amygdali pv. sesami]|nr:Carbon storage regulator-related protein [Pseudomonas amygdali pv. sesami]RMV78463.1 Carbon storage regulator-related protein [Pseudomonas amygdali pv. sesami]
MKLSIACIGALIFGEFLLEIGLPTTDHVLVKAGLLALSASIALFLAELGLAAMKVLRDQACPAATPLGRISRGSSMSASRQSIRKESAMLVLTRREGENILIEDGIQIQALAISEFDQIVRIGIEAPKVAIVQCRDIDRKVTEHKPSLSSFISVGGAHWSKNR